jgi:hypothetical protein
MPRNANAVVAQVIVPTAITTQPGTIQSVNANVLKTQLSHVAYNSTSIITPASAYVRLSPVPKIHTGIQEAATALKSIAIAQLVFIMI